MMRKTLNKDSMKGYRLKFIALLSAVLFGMGGLSAQTAQVTSVKEFKDGFVNPGPNSYSCGTEVFFGDNGAPGNYGDAVSLGDDSLMTRVFCADVGSSPRAKITFLKTVKLYSGDSLVIFKGNRPNPGYANDYDVAHDGVQTINAGYTYVSSGGTEQCLTVQLRIHSNVNRPGIDNPANGFRAVLGDQYACKSPGPEITVNGTPGIGVLKACHEDDLEIKITIDDPSSNYGRSIDDLDFEYEVTRFNGSTLSNVANGAVSGTSLGGSLEVFSTTLPSVSAGVYEVAFIWKENGVGQNQKCCTDTIRRYIQVAPEPTFNMVSPASSPFYVCETSEVTLSVEAQSTFINGHPNNPTQTQFEASYNIGEWFYEDDASVNQRIGFNGDHFVPDPEPAMEDRGPTSNYKVFYNVTAQDFGCLETFEFELDVADAVSAGLADNSLVVCADRGSDFTVLEALTDANVSGEYNVSSVSYDTIATPYPSSTNFVIGNGVSDEFNPNNGALNLTALEHFGFYTFKYTVNGVGQNPHKCPSDQVVVQVEIQEPPHAGIGDLDVDICEGSSIDLTSLLNADQDFRGIVKAPQSNGSFSNDDNQGNLVGTILDLSGNVTFTAGSSIAVATYTYTVTSQDCGTDETEIRLRIHRAPYAGENTTIQVCSTEPTFNIRDRFNTLPGLTVSSQGTYSLVSSTSGINYNASLWNANGKFVPGDQGSYPETDTICIKYKATNSIGCPEDEATICIEFQLEPFAGVSLTRTVCESDGVGNTINLHSIIGTPANQRPAKSNGIWSETSTNEAGLDKSNGDLDLSEAIGTTFGGNTGTFVYEYLIAGFGQCSDSKATLTLTIEKEVGPGTTADYFFCDSDVNPIMTDVVGAPAGGTWSGSGVNKMSSPLDVTSTFDVQSSGQVDGLPGYNVKYIIDNVACADVEWGARVKVFIAPEAGDDNVDEVELCKGAIDVDLMEFRKGTYDIPGNSIKVEFYDETNNRTLNIGTVGAGAGKVLIDFSPSSGNNTFAPGLHNFYHIVKRVVPGSPGIVVCEDSALIQINVLELPNAGGNGSFTALSSDTPVGLENFVPGHNPIGEFENLSGPGIVPLTLFDPSQATSFANVILHVTKNGIENDGCRDTSLVMAYVLQEMDPGSDGEIVSCETEKIDLFSGLTGNPEKQNLAITDGYTYINQGWRFGMTPSDLGNYVDLKNLFNTNTNINNVVNNDPLGYGPFYTVTPPAQVSSELDVTKFINAIAEAAPAPVVFVGGQSVATVEDRLDVPRYFQVDYRFEYVMSYDVPSLYNLRDTEFNDQKNNNNFEFWDNITNLTTANLGFDVTGIDTEKKASTLLEVSRNFKDLFEFNPDNPLLNLCAGEIQIDLNKWFRGKGNVVLPNGFKVYDYVVKKHELGRDSMAFFLDGAANSPAITFANGDVFLSTVGLAAGPHTLTAKIVTSDGEKPCQEVELDEIEFEIFEKPNAGQDAELDLCIEDNLQLFTELKNLDNTIDEDGVVGRYFGNGGNDWDDDDVSVLSGYTFIATPNTNTSAPIVPGAYDVYYSVQSEFGCYINNNRGNALLSDTSVVRINVVGKPKLGNPAFDSNGEILVCENYTFDPIVFLPGADQGGVWTDVTATGGLSTDVQGNVTFVTEISTLDNVTLTYGHDNGICPAEEITYDIRIIRDPNAGDETSAIICGSAVSEDLFALIDGSPDTDPQGVWSGDIAQQFFSGNLLNAAAVGSGVYDVTYTIFSEECRGFDEESGQLFVGGGAVLKDEVTMELEIERVPEAGTTNPDIEKVCGTNNTVNLLSKLNGFPDNTGYWTTSADPGSVFINGHFFDARTFIGDTLTFVYTVGGVACPEDKATIQKLVVVPPADGKGTRTASLCYEEDQINLYNSFGYSPTGGNWFRISSGGVQIPISNNDASFFDPRSLGVGQSKLMFIATGTFPCKNDTGIINVTVAPAPKAGKDSTISICTGVLLQDLTAFLAGNNKIGTFHTAEQTLISGVNFDVQTAGAGMVEGDLKTYDIYHEAITSPCDADSAKITLNLFPRPQAGGNVTVDVCNGLGTLNLLDIVGPNAFVGGTFSTLNQTILVEDALDANELDLTVLPEGTYTIFYKVSLPQEAVNPIGCNFDEAKLTINVLPLGEQDVFICSDKQAVDLYDYLLADVSGTWVDGSGGTELNGSLFNALAAGPGNRVFTLEDADVYCPSGIILNASIVDPIQLDSKGVVVSCEVGDPTYRITFTVVGGQPGTYSVAQGPSNGTYNPNTGTFTFVIDANDPYNIIIEDGISCNPLPVVGYPDCTDFDGDGIVNAIDKDDDNDGVPDLAESFGFDALADHDGDQVPNAEDGDFCSSIGGVINGQGKCSIFDLDGDGLLNQLEVDSDNDGIFDLYEVFFGQAIAEDMDGILNGASLTGMVDGWSDLAANYFVSIGSVAPDTDGDNLPDFLDTDSDNDGISDNVESAGFPVVDTDGDDTDDYRDLDSDDDSIEDVFEGASDTDGDGIADFRDEDADGDGIMDIQERITAAGLAPEDIDGDGKYNFKDLDSDGDLIPDEVEKDGAVPGVLANTDGDAFEDFRDIDSDNDGISDKIEAAGEPNRPVDSDNDGVPDYRSLDSDSDGTSDTEEAIDLNAPYDTDEDGIEDFREVDSDDDGISDAVERALYRGDLLDGDGIPDYRDFDSDGDGISDKDEAFFEADLETPTSLSDFDGNGVFNHQDFDSDGDNISDSKENGTEALQLGRPADVDNDGFKNFVDRDSDNDGVPDHIEGELDCDGDGVPAFLDYGDNCQIKIANIPEGISPNGDGVNDFWIIPNIQDFPGCKVQVFNRWGNLVYEMTDYDNSWGGTTSKGVVGDDILPSGTYYYLIDLNLGQDPLKGFIYISSDK